MVQQLGRAAARWCRGSRQRLGGVASEGDENVVVGRGWWGNGWRGGAVAGFFFVFSFSAAEARQRERKGQSERERGARVGLGDLMGYGPPVWGAPHSEFWAAPVPGGRGILKKYIYKMVFLKLNFLFRVLIKMTESHLHGEVKTFGTLCKLRVKIPPKRKLRSNQGQLLL